MEIGTMTVDKLDKRTELHVTINVTRQFRLRLAVARWLIWLAGVALGCGIEITTDSDEN